MTRRSWLLSSVALLASLPAFASDMKLTGVGALGVVTGGGGGGCTTASFVQAATGSNNSNNTGVTTGSITSTSGNSFIVCVTFDNTNTPTCTLSDSKSNTYSTAVSKATDGRHGQSVQMFRCFAGTGGASHTFTASFSATTSFVRVAACEISNMPGTSSVGNNGSRTDDAGTAIDITDVGIAVTTNQYVLGFCMEDSGGTSTVTAAGLGTLRVTVSAGNYVLSVVDFVAASNSTVQAQFTSTAANDFLGQVAAFTTC
jgi:hypothetical protein